MFGSNLDRQREPVHRGHYHVGDDKIEFALVGTPDRQGFDAVLGRQHRVAVTLKRSRYYLQNE